MEALGSETFGNEALETLVGGQGSDEVQSLPKVWAEQEQKNLIDCLSSPAVGLITRRVAGEEE